MLEVAGFYFDFFCFFHVPPFPFSSIFCDVFTESLAHLAVNACLVMPLFLLSTQVQLLCLFFCFYFFILEVSLSCSFVTNNGIMNNVCFALLLAWEKKIIYTKTLPKHRHRFLEV